MLLPLSTNSVGIFTLLVVGQWEISVREPKITPDYVSCRYASAEDVVDVLVKSSVIGKCNKL